MAWAGDGGEAETSWCICSLCVCLEEETLTRVSDESGIKGEAEGNGKKDNRISVFCTWLDGGSIH